MTNHVSKDCKAPRKARSSPPKGKGKGGKGYFLDGTAVWMIEPLLLAEPSVEDLPYMPQIMALSRSGLRQPGKGGGDTGAGLVGIGEQSLEGWIEWLKERRMCLSWEENAPKTRFKFGNSQDR